jgi:transcriptional regulator with XRE-family HTH domain
MSDNSYTNWLSMTDRGLSRVIGTFIKHHRLDQNKTQDALSRAAGISRSTLSLLERGEPVTLDTFIQVLRALDLLNLMDVFKVEKRLSPMMLAEMEQKARKRARSKGNTYGKATDDNPSDW